MSSLDVACRFICPVACGILVPQTGIEPVSPALEGRFLTTGPPGTSPPLVLIEHFVLFFSPLLAYQLYFLKNLKFLGLTWWRSG